MSSSNVDYLKPRVCAELESTISCLCPNKINLVRQNVQASEEEEKKAEKILCTQDDWKQDERRHILLYHN